MALFREAATAGDFGDRLLGMGELTFREIDPFSDNPLVGREARRCEKCSGKMSFRKADQIGQFVNAPISLQIATNESENFANLPGRQTGDR